MKKWVLCHISIIINETFANKTSSDAKKDWKQLIRDETILHDTLSGENRWHECSKIISTNRTEKNGKILLN